MAVAVAVLNAMAMVPAVRPDDTSRRHSVHVQAVGPAVPVAAAERTTVEVSTLVTMVPAGMLAEVTTWPTRRLVMAVGVTRVEPETVVTVVVEALTTFRG